MIQSCFIHRCIVIQSLICLPGHDPTVFSLSNFGQVEFLEKRLEKQLYVLLIPLSQMGDRVSIFKIVIYEHLHLVLLIHAYV